MQNRDLILRIVIMALLVYALTSLAAVRSDLSRTQQTADTLQEELAQLQKENTQLQAKLAEDRSDQEMQQLARQRLGMVMPGEKIFYFTTDREEQPWGWK